MNTPSSASYEAFGDAPSYVPETTQLQQHSLPGFSRKWSFADRNLREHQDMLGFEAEALPADSRLLVIGSGATRRFERELQVVRPDVLTISVDPLLRFGVTERHLEAIRYGTMRPMFGPPQLPREIMSGEAYYRKAAVCGGFAVQRTQGEDTYLPFKDNSFATVLALHSLPQYTPNKAIPALLAEINRVLETGGRARLHPIFNADLPITRDTTAELRLVDPVFDHPERSSFDSIRASEGMRFSFSKVV